MFLWNRYALMTALVAGIVASVSVGRADDVKLKGIKCLICGMQVNDQVTADFKGAKIFFGCSACPARFKADTKKYAAKANLQLVATKQFRQKACPVMGGKLDKNLKMTVGGTDVLFCCAKCKTGASKLKGDAQIEKLFNDTAFKKGFELVKKGK